MGMFIKIRGIPYPKGPGERQPAAPTNIRAAQPPSRRFDKKKGGLPRPSFPVFTKRILLPLVKVEGKEIRIGLKMSIPILLSESF